MLSLMLYYLLHFSFDFKKLIENEKVTCSLTNEMRYNVFEFFIHLVILYLHIEYLIIVIAIIRIVEALIAFYGSVIVLHCINYFIYF